MLDKARQKTDKRLAKMERDISRMYRMHPALIAIRKEFAKYMKMVQKKTRSSYDAYINETDPDKKQELKKIYSDEVKKLTLQSKDFQKLVKKITKTMAKVNQDALDIVNNEMVPVYTDNYNQVAEECKKVGIKVNG
jgi:uncharacterized protein YegL